MWVPAGVFPARLGSPRSAGPPPVTAVSSGLRSASRASSAAGAGISTLPALPPRGGSAFSSRVADAAPFAHGPRAGQCAKGWRRPTTWLSATEYRVTWSGDGVLLSASLLGRGPNPFRARTPHHLAKPSVTAGRRAPPCQHLARESRTAAVDPVGSSLALPLAWMTPTAIPTRTVDGLTVLSSRHLHHHLFCPSLEPSRCCPACLSS